MSKAAQFIKLTEERDAEYLKWKRKNVTLRGIREQGSDNSGGSHYGRGLYTAFLGNKAMAKGYGKVYFVVGAIPKKPKVFNNVNDAEIWTQKIIMDYCKKAGRDYAYDTRYFYEHTTLEKEIMDLGFDGIIIKGREMVNYDPPEDVRYYNSEDALYRYYEQNIAGGVEYVKS